jgi:uncharacterized metal-binding protein YceD (DUF177 family)
MKIFRSSVPKGRVLPVDETYAEWDPALFARCYPLLGIRSAYLKGNFENTDGILTFNGVIGGVVVLSDSRTNEPFEEEYKIKDVFQLLEDEDDESATNGYIFPDNGINLEEFVFSVLRSEVPIKPLKPGSEAVPSIDERSYLIEGEEQNSSPFDVLLGLDLEEK